MKRLSGCTCKPGEDGRHRPACLWAPSSYGLSRADVAAERARLMRAGWQPWEINTRLVHASEVPLLPEVEG